MYVQGTLIKMCAYSTYQGCTLRVHLAKCAVKVHVVDVHAAYIWPNVPFVYIIKMYVQGTLIQMCAYSTYQGCTLRVHLAKCAVKVHVVDVHAAYIWPRCTVCVHIRDVRSGYIDSNVQLQYISGMYT
jgi:hypothetical protein